MNRVSVRLRAAFWNGIAGALPRVAVLLAGFYVAQRFGADAFARYSLALSTLAVAGSLPGATMTTVASKFVPDLGRRRAPPRRRLRGNRALRTGARGARRRRALPRRATTRADLRRRAAGRRPDPGRGVRGGHDGGRRRARGPAVGSARFGTAAAAYLGGFVLFALGIVPLADQVGIAGVLIALGLLYLGAAVVGLAVSGRRLVRDARAPRLRRRMPALLGFFVPTLIAAGLVAPVVWGVNALVSRGPEPLANLARFNAAYSWFAVVSFVPAVLAQVEFVRMSQAKARGDTALLAREMRRFVLQNALVMLPIVVVGAALASQLVGVYRLEGPAAERTLMLMLAAAFVASLGNPAGLFLAVIDRIWLASGLNVAWGIITLALAWWLRDGGAQSVALAFLLGYAFHCLVATLLAQRLLAREPGS